jgi:serine protease AprX
VDDFVASIRLEAENRVDSANTDNMSETKETVVTKELLANISEPALIEACSVCARIPTDGLIPFEALEEQLRELVAANALAGKSNGVCAQCIEVFKRARNQIEAHGAIFEQTSYVLPTPIRLGADQRFTGRGVTMAFLDSGFYAHPDLTEPTNRIVAYHNIFDPLADLDSLKTGDVASWHGMMTSVVAAGNGHLSQGFYRGIAPDANLVLVKIGRTGRIPDKHIEQGLNWVLKHRAEHTIKVVNILSRG